MQTVSILLKPLSFLDGGRGGGVLALLTRAVWNPQGPQAVIPQTPRLTFVQTLWQFIHSPGYMERVEEMSPDYSRRRTIRVYSDVAGWCIRNIMQIKYMYSIDHKKINISKLNQGKRVFFSFTWKMYSYFRQNHDILPWFLFLKYWYTCGMVSVSWCM